MKKDHAAEIIGQGPGIEIERNQVLFETALNRLQYDVTADGRRFLVITPDLLVRHARAKLNGRLEAMTVAITA